MASAKKTLVIVESPSKAKTIGKYLGANYKVIASVGHVRDLPKSRIGVDVENDYEPDYINIRGKGDVIKEIKSQAKGAGKIYLATDPDREGEAISWHLAYILNIDPATPCRVVFNEITKETVKKAIKAPRAIDLSLVDAQQARRIMDRLVGYQLSPILWSKIRSGLSAGRVQSSTLKMIVDREREIRSFIPEEYWNISVDFKKGRKFTADLVSHKGRKLHIQNGEKADRIEAALNEGSYEVASVNIKTTIRKPFAPFTTSSLQQDAANKLGFATKKTMSVVQQLYEGVDIKGQGTVGLVTYIRTDSTRVSEEARAQAREFIERNFGRNYTANHVYTNKKGAIQDAHEAIRPTSIDRDPELIKASLTKDQYVLYKLIWSRFLASQMASAKFDSMNVDIKNGDYILKAVGSKLIFDGYKKIYSTSFDDEKDKILPELKEGEELNAEGISKEQKFTNPPTRFTEASLVREMEEKNIGRPSTYVPTIGTISDKRYIKREKKNLVPTDLGFVVTEMLEEYFKDIVDAGFTSDMEDRLDSVEEGNTEWKDVIRDFYPEFREELTKAEEELDKVEVEKEEPVYTGENCEICGKPMVKKAGRFGEFIACSGYPECKNTKAIVEGTGVSCPSCGEEIIARRSRRGKLFYGCSGFPACKNVYWYRPVDRKCPECGSLLLERNAKSVKYSCSNSECKYKEK